MIWARICLGFITGGLMVVTALILVKAAGGQEEVLTGHCSVDPTADEFIDTSDLVLFTNVFGTNVPELDISPPLAPNGYVDTADISAVTAHFGEQCWGTVGHEPDPPGMAPLSVWDCNFEVGGFGVAPMGNWTLLGDWGGKSRCKDDGTGGFTSHCVFTFERQNGDGSWTDVAVTEGVVASGAYCIAPGYAGSYLPHYERLRGTLYHWITHDGQVAHSASTHGSSYTFCVTVSPCQ